MADILAQCSVFVCVFKSAGCFVWGLVSHPVDSLPPALRTACAIRHAAETHAYLRPVAPEDINTLQHLLSSYYCIREEIL